MYYFRSLSSKHVFKLRAPDHSVARFIKHSPSHMSQLETALSYLATVKIWISAEKGDSIDKIIEYQCRPVEVSLHDFFRYWNFTRVYTPLVFVRKFWQMRIDFAYN